MSRSLAPPLYAVHAEVLAIEHPLSEAAGHPVSVEDWQEALELSQVVVLQEEQELAEAPPDPTFADTEAVVVDATATVVRAARAL